MDTNFFSVDELNKMQFVFIVGIGRSGTTLLQTIFDTNPSVLSPIEAPFIIHLKKKYFPVKKWTPSLVDELLEDLYNEVFFKNFWNIDKKKLRDNINHYPLHELSFATICKLIYLNFTSPFKKDKVELLIDKNPIYSIFIAELMEVYPDAKFIHIIRDYRDNIVSRRKAFGQNNLSLSAQKWVMYNATIDKYKRKFPEKFIEIRYEDLVTFPENFIPKICLFLGVKFQKEMFDFHKTTSNLYFENKSSNKVLLDLANKIHLNLTNPINTTQIDKWKNELKPEEIEVIEHIAGDFGKKYDYISVTKIWKLNYFFISKKTYLTCRINKWVTVNYYKLPFYIRKTLKRISAKLYDWFKFSHKFNKADFYLKNDQKSN